MKSTFLYIILLLLFNLNLNSQSKSFTFAHITDTHIGNETAEADLLKTIEDINENSNIEFVIHTGDVTEFGSDDELKLAKSILDKLNKPLYIVSGNHDSKWSENGGNSFIKTFKKESFIFEKNGYIFLGTSSGPVMRMGNGQIPREQMDFLEKTVDSLKTSNKPVIFINHYPMDSSISNWYQAIDLIKKLNVQAQLLGHGHINKVYNFEGIPAVMGRSNLSSNKHNLKEKVVAGYNIVTIENGKMTYKTRLSQQETLDSWAEIQLKNHNFKQDLTKYPRPDFSINDTFKNVENIWSKQYNFDIGAGTYIYKNNIILTNYNGEIWNINKNTNQEIWKIKTSGRIFSTPSINKNILVVGSSDNKIFGIDLKNGNIIWTFNTKKSVLSSPSIKNNKVFIGSSDGTFYCLNLKNGNIIWTFNKVDNFVETKPLIYKKNVYFGSWGNSFYALNQKNGNLIWQAKKGTNRMVSPAAVIPVAAKNKIFIVAPDRYMTAFDYKTGKEIYYSKEFSCRETIGISQNKKIIYIKSMLNGDLFAFDSKSESQKLVWQTKTDLGYEISPSPIIEHNNLVFIPTQSGIICVIDKNTKKIAWKHKVSNTLINNILPIDKNKIIVSTQDGLVSIIKWKL